MPSLEEVRSQRERLWDGGYRPVAVATLDKRPLARAWSELARQDPPDAVTRAPSLAELNTGILCDGLRVIDVDVDDKSVVDDIVALIYDILGEAPLRRRPNSPRVTALFRAAEGQPKKLVLTGQDGQKIEALGHGQQVLSFGTHPSGAELSWYPEAPGDITLEQLPSVTEEQIERFFKACAPLIGAEEVPAADKGDRAPNPKQLADDQLKLVAALSDVDNGPKDWERWNRIGMAFYAGMGGSGLGWQAWNAWCARHPAYDFAEVKERWDNYRNSPPKDLGAGTILWMAKNKRSDVPAHQETTRILTGENFVESYAPPDWVIDGIIQTGRLYACTSRTNHGKTAVWLHAASMITHGRRIGNLDVQQGNVLILAGENPEDLKARMIGMVRTFNLDPKQLPYVLPGSFPMNEEEAERLRQEIIALGIPFVLIIGDTAASFFPGEDEDDNVQAGTYARTLRSFTTMPGNPAVVALCHPVKNATQANLLPRGGSAFLNEMDGNLVLWSEVQGESTVLHWHGKIRGPDFAPISYALKQVSTGLYNQKGREDRTVVAEPITDLEAGFQAANRRHDEDAVLRCIANNPDWPIAKIAEYLSWTDQNGLPLKSKVHRLIKSLADDKLVSQRRKGGVWSTTENGRKVLEEIENA